MANCSHMASSGEPTGTKGAGRVSQLDGACVRTLVDDNHAKDGTQHAEAGSGDVAKACDIDAELRIGRELPVRLMCQQLLASIAPP